ncbi:MAG: DUF1887 family protein [Helicobacteraceae bacterium]|nr:DUF1887 family protein [Helicobacteraceae bacterium]
MVLISLLGDFDSLVIPVFFEYKDEITTHILARNIANESEKKAARIMLGLSRIRQKYRLKCTLREMQIEAGEKGRDHLFSIIALAESIKQFAPPNQLYINLSDGAASDAIILSRELLDYGANIIISDRFKNDITILTNNEMKKRYIKNSMGIEDHIISKGYEILSYKTKNALENKREYIEAITRNFPIFQRYRKRVIEYKEIDEERYSAIIPALVKLGATDRRGRPTDENYIKGGLFEEIIYFLAKKLAFDDIMTSVQVRYESINNIKIENEFDILAIKENHLYIIECKFRDRLDGENLIYKYDALIKQMDNDGKVMIINVASTESKEALKRGKKIHKNFEKGAIYRAQLNNISIYYEPTLETNKLIAKMRSFFNV